MTRGLEIHKKRTSLLAKKKSNQKKKIDLHNKTRKFHKFDIITNDHKNR